MSDHPKRYNDATPDRARPGKRLEKKAKPALTPEQAQKQKEKRIMVVMIVLAVIMVIAAALALLYKRWVKRPDIPAPGPKASDALLGPDASPEPTLDIDAIEPKVGGERKSDAIYTILIFGSDTTSGLTDTMMVATYDVTNQRAAVMSIPRDTLINSSARPNISAKKLNAVYNVYGQGDDGIEALRNEVSELVGFTPDYYVQIDWELVGEMVDAIGGVWFDNPYHMEYYDPYQDLSIYQEKGYRKINGNAAMQIVRWRHNGKVNGVTIPGGGDGSDLCRLQVQHAFLKAVLDQTLQIGNITKIGQLIKLFNSRVKSDLSVENMLWFAQEAVLGGLKVSDVEFLTMPTQLGLYYQFGRDWDFVYPIQGRLLEMTNEYLNPYKEQVTIKQLDLMSVAADGSLRSSTGRLAAPELGQPPVRETDEPTESDPIESDPIESDPTASDPVESDPVESQPPASAPIEPDPSATEAGGDVFDWGDTTD
ncbi:MAG: LCP family protein [Oscillospiraceae bacterium]|nr:LCP family protein [Oscillospiraceae bacterium]